MNNDRPSTKRIIWTLLGWVVGFVAIAAIVIGIASALTPKAAPVPSVAPEATAALVPTVSPVPTAASVPVTLTSATPTSVPATSPGMATHAVTPSTTTTSKPLSGQVVAIDAGHQAKGDPSLEPIGPGSSSKKAKVTTGATGVSTHNTESEINLAVALKLQAALVAKGARVVMIRTRENVNISNSQRAAIANNAHAAIFIRLHCDSSTNHSVAGISTLVPVSNKWTEPIVSNSRRAGSLIQSAVVQATRASSRGVVTRGDLSGFNWSKVPSVLVEMGFMSNSVEDRKLATPAYQHELALGLAQGIQTYLKSR